MTVLHRLIGNLLKPSLSYMSRGRLPQLDGHLSLPGLQKPVAARRDRWGIPHISAANRHDLFLAQGFVHAQDRLWQMELNRRMANGRLAELFGPLALETDRLVRTLGFGRLAQPTWEQLSTTAQADLTAYTAGVNALLAQMKQLPIEFSLVRHRPEPWQVLDSVAFSCLQGWTLSHGWAGELVRAQLIEKLGPDLAADLEPRYAERHPITLPPGISFDELETDPMTEAAAGPFLNRGADVAGRGSNGWVISARRSASGHAILGNVLHLPVSSPSLWYYVHLYSAGSDGDNSGLHVTGASLPGLPYVLVGHNGQIAWGATLAFTDTEDLFIEKVDPANDGRYLFEGEWRRAEIVAEKIGVKGQPDHVERVVITHHGPIISNTLAATANETAAVSPADNSENEPATRPALALAAMSLRPSAAFDGFRLLNEAGNWDEFVTAVSHMQVPTLNLVYADAKDNIGYWVSGTVPVRARGQGLVPAPGWSGDHEWTGEIPFAEMPHCLNPEQGYLLTCNHRIAGDDYPHFLGSLWMNGYRARRLEEMINSQELISTADCRRFHYDLYSIPGRELVETLAGLETEDADARVSLDLLRQWDGELAPESSAAAVYQVLLSRLTQAILEPHLGRELLDKFVGAGPHALLASTTEFYGHWTVTLLRWLRSTDSPWIAGSVGRKALLVRGLSETTATLRRLLGNDTGRWHWGRLHQVRFAHSLGAQPPLDIVFNQGPYPIGGDTDTVAQTAVLPNEPYENNAFSLSYWQTIHLGEPGSSEALLAPGQSGQLGSPHYGDLIEPWLAGQPFAPAWDEAAVVAASQHHLSLLPVDVEKDEGTQS
jgi:penicillin G amidase